MPSLIECAGIEENMRLCRKFGLDFIELNMNLPMFQPDELSHAIDYAQKHGVGITLHADENLNCMDFSVPVADAYLSVLVDTIQIARECGVPTVNLHLNRGVYFSLPDRKIFLYDTYRERYLDRVQEMRDRCAEAAGKDVHVLVENTNGFLPFQRAAIDLLLKSDTFGLTWDIGHSQTAAIDDTSFLLEHLNRVEHFHLRYFVCACLYHHDRILGAGYGHMDIGFFPLLEARVDDQSAVHSADGNGTGRTVPWNVRNRQRHRGTDHTADFRRTIQVYGHDSCNDDHIIVIALRE